MSKTFNYYCLVTCSLSQDNESVGWCVYKGCVIQLVHIPQYITHR